MISIYPGMQQETPQTAFFVPHGEIIVFNEKAPNRGKSEPNPGQIFF
jgi:hypothetical protein